MSLRAMDAALGPGWFTNVPLGAMVCTAILRGCYESQTDCPEDGDAVFLQPIGYSPPLETMKADLFGDYDRYRKIWHLTDIEKFPIPVPCKGAQGFFNWAPTEAV